MNTIQQTNSNFKYFGGEKSQSPTELGIKFSFDPQHISQQIQNSCTNCPHSVAGKDQRAGHTGY